MAEPSQLAQQIMDLVSDTIMNLSNLIDEPPKAEVSQLYVEIPGYVVTLARHKGNGVELQLAKLKEK